MEINEEIFQVGKDSESIAQVIINAYREKYPTPDAYEKTVVFNSLLIVIIKFLKSISHEERIFVILALMNEVEKLMKGL